MNKITLTIKGDKDTVDTLIYISDQFRTPIEPLERSTKSYLREIMTNFRDEGRTFGQAWPRLSPTTIAIKRKLYKEGKAIAINKPLVRTGKLRTSFGSDMPNKQTSRIYNDSGYAEFHQTGGTVKLQNRTVTVPKRVLAAVDTDRVEMVARIFTGWIEMLIKSKKAG